jgi:hypothetical protein
VFLVLVFVVVVVRSDDSVAVLVIDFIGRRVVVAPFRAVGAVLRFPLLVGEGEDCSTSSSSFSSQK